MKYLVLLAIMLFSACSQVHQEMQHGLPLVYSDDFSNGMDNWQFSDAASWQINEEKGNKFLSLIRRESAYSPKYRSPGHIALLKNLELSDYVITFKVRGPFPTKPAHRDCCVFFAYQNPEQFYYVHTGFVPDPHSGQIMIVNNAPRIALTQNKNNTPWRENTWQQVKVVRNSMEGSIKIYFENMENPYMEVNDTTFSKGRFGIGSFDDINDFDDFKVYGR